MSYKLVTESVTIEIEIRYLAGNQDCRSLRRYRVMYHKRNDAGGFTLVGKTSSAYGLIVIRYLQEQGVPDNLTEQVWKWIVEHRDSYQGNKTFSIREKVTL